jgi:hypothetical protein
LLFQEHDGLHGSIDAANHDCVGDVAERCSDSSLCTVVNLQQPGQWAKYPGNPLR